MNLKRNHKTENKIKNLAKKVYVFSGMSKILLKTQAVKNFVDWQQNS